MPTTSPKLPPSNQTYHTSLLNPPLAKSLANTLVHDPLVLTLNTEIYMLASEASTLTFSSALQRYIAKLAHCNDIHDIPAYTRACLQILVIYSLKQENYSWFQSCCYEDVRVTSQVFDGRVSSFAEGDLERHRQMLVEGFWALDMEMGLRDVGFVEWDPRVEGAWERKKGVVENLDGQRDGMVGEAVVLVLCPMAL
ncbi:MAG: hypothetical protein Q9213_008358 [Squamulea squamosa]